MPTRIYSAGELNQRVQLQQRAAGENSLGERSGAWLDFGGRLWAKAEPFTGREFLAAGAEQRTTDTRFVIRYRAGVTAALRLLWNDQPYEIVSAVAVDGGTEWIEIMATTGARDGRL
jgi:SPP1 family predicted phage head-tail adaptor